MFDMLLPCFMLRSVRSLVFLVLPLKFSDGLQLGMSSGGVGKFLLTTGDTQLNRRKCVPVESDFRVVHLEWYKRRFYRTNFTQISAET